MSKQTTFSFLGSETVATGKRSTRRDVAEATTQMPLLFRARDEDLDEMARVLLERRLMHLIEDRCRLCITDNRHTMISSMREGRILRLRLHHMFLDADDATIRALARYVTRSDRRAERLLDEYIESNRHRIRRDGRRRPRLRTAGCHHDLAELFHELNTAWFGGMVESVRVTWGRRAPQQRRLRRSIRLGTYVAEDSLIRIHPVLDQPWVPRFFVAYVLFHEMLHVVVPAPVRNGRQCFHGREFRAHERRYPDYGRALAWEKKNLARLLSG
jgi:hypothetical protein